MATLDFLPLLLQGLVVTLEITAGAACVSLLMAFSAAFARLSEYRLVRFLALMYIDLFRGTSALVQLFWAYFALPLIGVNLTAMSVAVTVLGLNIGAYGAEVVRSALQAIPRAQREAAQALNFNPYQQMRYIILPQALRIMMPSFTNLLIELLKTTSLVSLITLSDLTFQAQVLRGATLRSAEIFGLTLLLYFAIARLIAMVMRRLEKSLNVGFNP